MVTLGVAINGVSSKVIDTTIQIQKAEKALTAITRSSAAAGVEIDFVRNVANNSGQVFTSLTDTYSRFLASANSSGQILNETHRQFATVSQAAGILGLSVEDTQGVFRAMEQMLSKGTVQAEELRGQLGDRLPGAFAIGAQAMGVTTQKLGDLMKKGEVLSADFLPKFTSQLAKVFNVDITKPVEG
ncbi:tape measure protein, partial [Parvimonas sp. M20]